MNQPMVSIVIPVYNGSNYIARAIDSVLAQTYRNCEVIVVNDGSKDEGRTEAICQSYGDRIRYLSKPNGGVSSALNHGIRHMRGDFFCWLSHDDYYGLGKIVHQMAELETLPKDAILYSDYYMVYPEIRMKARVDFSKKYARTLLDEPLFPVFHGLVSGCTVLFHRSHFDRVGLFDETLLTTQDYDLWFRMFQGQRVHYCKHADVFMCEHKNQGSRTIPEHRTNENELWKALTSQVPTADMCRMSGTPYLFYREMANVYQRFGFFEAKAYCEALAKAEMDRRAQSKMEGSETLADILYEKYEIVVENNRHATRTRLFTWANIVYLLYEIHSNGLKVILNRVK